MSMLAPGGEDRRVRRQQRQRRRALAGLVLGLAVLAVAPSACSAMGASARGARLERMKKSPQWGEDTFTNRLPTPMGLEESVSTWTMLKAFLGGEEPREPTEAIPVVARTPASLDGPPAGAPRITWMGHSSMLIELDGRRVLTDPVWGERASPVSFAGPKRFHPPPVPLEGLPAVDAVIISHDHYDHLDTPTIQALADRVPLFVVPLGVGAHLESWGVAPERIVELDWWEAHEVAGLRLVATPSRHFSGRGLTNRNETLWASWAIVGPEHRVFFSGDTGMHSDFEEIGERLGPFDVTMHEVGAYNTWWRNVHLGPEQAVDAHVRLQGRLFLPVHWGTFNLALHGWTEPPERLLVEAARRGVTMSIPKPGETIDSAQPRLAEQWWPELPWQTAEQAPVVATELPWLATAE